MVSEQLISFKESTEIEIEKQEPFGNLTNNQVLQFQNQMIEGKLLNYRLILWTLLEQDIQLDELSKVINRQKELGLVISDELEEQSEIMQRLERGVDNTNARMDNVLSSIF